MSKRMQSNILLLLAAFVWGTAFVAQKSGGSLGTFTYNGIRTLMGFLFLLIIIAIKDHTPSAKSKRKEMTIDEIKKGKRILTIGGICCGVALFVASNLQQFGIMHTTVGKAGFITSLYTIIVPIISIILKKRVRPVIWLCVIIAIFGFYLLSMGSGEFKLQFGDAIILICALVFAVHIMIIDHFVPHCDGVKLSCIQFLVSGLLGIVFMFIFEKPAIHEILNMWFPILYAGILSSGVGYTLQIVGQRHAEPTQATLLMSLEAVFSALAGALLLAERMAVKEYLGCAIIFAAVIIAQLPERKRIKS